MKRIFTKWEEVFANHISDKWLLSKIFKNSYNSEAKASNPIRTRAVELKRRFSKVDTELTGP